MHLLDWQYIYGPSGEDISIGLGTDGIPPVPPYSKTIPHRPRFIRLGGGDRYALIVDSPSVGGSVTGSTGGVIGIHAPAGGPLTVLGFYYLNLRPIAACAVRDTQQLLVATCTPGTTSGDTPGAFAGADILLFDLSGSSVSLVSQNTYWPRLVTDWNHGTVTIGGSSSTPYVGAYDGALVSFDSTYAALFVNSAVGGAGNYGGYDNWHYCKGYIPLVSGVPQPEVINHSSGGWAGGDVVVFDAWARSPHHVLVMTGRQVNTVPPSTATSLELWYQPSVVNGFNDALESSNHLEDAINHSRPTVHTVPGPGTFPGSPGYMRLPPNNTGRGGVLDGDLWLYGHSGSYAVGLGMPGTVDAAGTVPSGPQWIVPLGPSWDPVGTQYSAAGSILVWQTSHPIPLDDSVNANLNDLAPGGLNAFGVTFQRPFMVNAIGITGWGSGPEPPGIYQDPSWFVRGSLDSGPVFGSTPGRGGTGVGEEFGHFLDVISLPALECLVSAAEGAVAHLAFDNPGYAGPVTFTAPYDGYFVPEPDHYGDPYPPTMGENDIVYNDGYYSAVVGPLPFVAGHDYPTAEWWYYRPPGWVRPDGTTENIQGPLPAGVTGPVFPFGWSIQFGIGYHLSDRPSNPYYPGDLAVQQGSGFAGTAHLLTNVHSTNFGAAAWGRVYTKSLPPSLLGEPRFQQLFSPCPDIGVGGWTGGESKYVYGPFVRNEGSVTCTPIPMIWTFRRAPAPPPPPPPPPSERGALTVGPQGVVVRRPFAHTPTGSKSVALTPR